MASTRNPLQEFLLTPHQQTLLLAALNSNNPANAPANSAIKASPPSLDTSPVQPHGLSLVQESPYLDYDYDLGGADSSFDLSFDNTIQDKMIDDYPGAPSTAKSDSTEHDSTDKRSYPDDDEDENGAKRRESEDKVAKKPGRKPLTTEPTSKRKAQNRAAQRAFRERKEKHLKDLETKVQELEKASKAVNHENSLLRAKVDNMTIELNEYKKRVSLLASSGPTVVQGPKTFGQPFISNINDVNFQFEFPRFGKPLGPPAANNNSAKRSVFPPQKPDSNDQVSPMEKPNDNLDNHDNGNSSSHNQMSLDSQYKSSLTSGSIASASRNSFDSHFSPGAAASTSSPSASSHSNMGGPSSSCGTSPEPYTQSPMGFKPLDTLTTIGEEQPDVNNQGLGRFPSVDMTNFNWLPQNNFQFDPQLFGDYREPQDHILSSGGIDDSFFNEAFDVDFTTPYNLPPINSPAAKKGDIIAQIDAAKNADELDSNGQLLTCNKIWEKLQNCPKVQNGDFDLDGLCADLQKKAKCSGSGAVVNEKDFKTIMKKYLGKTDQETDACDKALDKKVEERKARGELA